MTVTFTDLVVAKRILSRFLVPDEMTLNDFDLLFVKTFEGLSTATIFASEEKPIIIHFKAKTHKMTYSAHYVLKTKYGFVF